MSALPEVRGRGLPRNLGKTTHIKTGRFSQEKGRIFWKKMLKKRDICEILKRCFKKIANITIQIWGWSNIGKFPKKSSDLMWEVCTGSNQCIFSWPFVLRLRNSRDDKLPEVRSIRSFQFDWMTHRLISFKLPPPGIRKVRPPVSALPEVRKTYLCCILIAPGDCKSSEGQSEDF